MIHMYVDIMYNIPYICRCRGSLLPLVHIGIFLMFHTHYNVLPYTTAKENTKLHQGQN